MLVLLAGIPDKTSVRALHGESLNGSSFVEFSVQMPSSKDGLQSGHSEAKHLVVDLEKSGLRFKSSAGPFLEIFS